MSPKQKEYQAILVKILPWLRNVSTWSWLQRFRDKSCYFDTQLVHNLPISMWEEDFVDHDIWFLNHQARAYVERCNPQISPNYDAVVVCIRNLFKMIPEERKAELEWGGPSS
jgi:hypothetical protein